MSSTPVRILELRSVRGTGGGPEKTILLGTAMTDRRRYAITVAYVRDLRDDIFGIDARASELDIDYVEIRERHSFDVGVLPQLRRLVHDRRIDIVHSHDYKTNLLAYLLARSDGVIPLATLHGYTGDSWKERVYYAIDKRLVRRFPLTIAVSGDLRAELIRRGSAPDRVIRVLNGIDERRFCRDRSQEAAARRALSLEDDDIVIGAVGRVERQKRFDLLMEAFADVRKHLPGLPLRLVIAGDGSLMESLQNLRRELALGDDCRLVGHRSDVARLHHAFDLFVQSSDYEGTPNAVLEAMAFETPVVATDVGGTNELIENGTHGVIVPPGDRTALGQAIIATLGDREAASRRAQAARQRVETTLSFRARMAAVEAVYDRLIAGRVSRVDEAARDRQQAAPARQQ
jgi:glycosyltransferase involved in cell wall biosynthesis